MRNICDRVRKGLSVRVRACHASGREEKRGKNMPRLGGASSGAYKNPPIEIDNGHWDIINFNDQSSPTREP
jgi:hypothetical protein